MKNFLKSWYGIGLILASVGVGLYFSGILFAIIAIVKGPMLEFFLLLSSVVLLMVVIFLVART